LYLRRLNIAIEARIVVLIIILLLLFDRSFSKLAIIEPLYVHDALLITATFFALIKFPIKVKFKSLFLLINLSLIYLIYSLINSYLSGNNIILVVRQFFLFFYLILSYVIANKFFKNPDNINKAVNFIKKTAKYSVILQLYYFFYLYLTVPDYTPLKGFSYISAVGVMGVIVYGAYILVYFKGYKKFFGFLSILVISSLLGHASSFFAAFLVLLVHFYISFSPKIRGISLGVLIILIIILFQTPQFNDANAGWRLLYWSHVLETALFENYLILGKGFGNPYMTLEFAGKIAKELNSTFMYTSVNVNYERWITPPHNSFLTMVHNVGLIPVILLFIPLKEFFNQIFFKKRTTDKNRLFLFYSLFGLIVWCSFNVILELPHSAIYFWLVYFTYIFYAKKQIET